MDDPIGTIPWEAIYNRRFTGGWRWNYLIIGEKSDFRSNNIAIVTAVLSLVRDLEEPDDSEIVEDSEEGPAFRRALDLITKGRITSINAGDGFSTSWTISGSGFSTPPARRKFLCVFKDGSTQRYTGRVPSAAAHRARVIFEIKPGPEGERLVTVKNSVTPSIGDT